MLRSVAGLLWVHPNRVAEKPYKARLFASTFLIKKALIGTYTDLE